MKFLNIATASRSALYTLKLLVAMIMLASFGLSVSISFAQSQALSIVATSKCGKSPDEADESSFVRVKYSDQQVMSLRSNSDLGDSAAILNYARWDKHGHIERLSLLRQAAKANNLNAQFVLSTYPQSGLSAAEAMGWLQLAATQGHNAAQARLARQYRSQTAIYGKGAEIVADFWAERAAENGNGDSLSFLCRRAYRMAIPRGDQEYQQAVKWCKKAEALGCNTAFKMLGEMYQHGHGVKQDVERAKRLLDKYLDNPLFQE